MARAHTARFWLAALAVLAGCGTLALDAPLGEPSSEPPAVPIEQAWERDVGAAFGPSAPLVTDRYVMVGTRRGEVVVLDGATGRVEGVGELGDSVEGQIATSEGGGVVYVPMADRRGGVRAIDVQSGGTDWRWEGGLVSGGVVRVGGVVVAAARGGTVAGIDARTGEQVWGRERGEGAQILAAPSVLGDGVVVADDRGRVVLYDARTGAERWTAELDEPVYEAPDTGEGVVLSTVRGSVVRLDAGTGAEMWRLRSEPAIRFSTAATRDGVVAVGGTDGVVRALDLATGVERWRWQTDGNVTARPLWLGDHVAVGTHDERLVLLDAGTGQEVWSTELRGRIKSALAIGGSRLIVLTEPRHVVAFQSAP